MADAARYLGLSPQTTLDLVSLGLLFAERGPDLDGSPHWAFSPQAVTECYDEVAKGVLPWVLDSTTMDLTQAAQILSVVGLDVAGILKHVAQRELYGHLPERSGGCSVRLKSAPFSSSARPSGDGLTPRRLPSGWGCGKPPSYGGPKRGC